MKNHLKENAVKPMNILFIAVALACFVLRAGPNAFGVVPPPDGGYPGFNTAEGQKALFGLTTGVGNTAVGWYSLFSDTDGSFNTGVGAGTLLFNVGNQSTGEGVSNTAIGTVALLFNTTGSENTAVGTQALFSNTEGTFNTALGFTALANNTTGEWNTAIGGNALFSNTTGDSNTANGYRALRSNATGAGNTAIGNNALQFATGNFNTALGAGAGQDQTSGSGNVYIGVNTSGVAGENDTTYIRNVYDSQASARPLYVNSDNKIGTLISSRRYKEDIKPMNKASEGIFALNPVTFRYKKEIDRSQALSFGLIAEEVAEISPDLITRDQEGKPQTVRYEAVNAMLLNEFLKEHKTVAQQGCKIEEQEATIAQLKSTVRTGEATIVHLTKQVEILVAHAKEQDSKIQNVSAQLELSRPDAQFISISH